MNFLSLLTDLILPPRCPVSGEIVDHPTALSPHIWAGLHFITDPCCGRCGLPFAYAPPEDRGREAVGGARVDDREAGLCCATCLRHAPAFTQARSALVYDDASRGLILGFKHGDRLEAVIPMVPWLVRAGAVFWDKVDVIVPVPLHPLRLIRRRYNQAAVLGHHLRAATGILHIPDMLKRVRATPSQGHLNGAARVHNVRHAFALHPRRRAFAEGKRVLLIDDVYTTGATLNECAKTLHQGGAAAVYVLTLARAVWE